MAAGGTSAASVACGAGQIPSGGSRGQPPTRLSRAGDSLTDAGLVPYRPRDSMDVLRSFLDDGPVTSSVATSHMASASALEFPVIDSLGRPSQTGAAGPRGRCSMDWPASAAAVAAAATAMHQRQQQAAPAARPQECMAQVVDRHLPIAEEPGEGDVGERERECQQCEAEGEDEERRMSRTSASSTASAGSQLSASSMGLPTSGSVCGAGSTPRGGNSTKGMATASASATPAVSVVSGSASVPPPGASARSISRLMASISGLGGSRSVGSVGHAGAVVGARPVSAAGVGTAGTACAASGEPQAASSQLQPGMAAEVPPLASISTGRASVGATASGAQPSASSFGQPLQGGVLSSLRKAASDIVSQLRALRPGKGGTGAATPAAATPTAAAAAAHGSVFAGGCTGPAQHQHQYPLQAQPRLLHTVHECSVSQHGRHAAPARGISNAGGGRMRYSYDGTGVNSFNQRPGPAPQVRARAPSASAAWASMLPQYDERTPSLGNSGKDAMQSLWVAPGFQDLSCRADGTPVDPMLLPTGHSFSFGTTGATTGLGTTRGPFLDEVGLEPQGSDIMPDMWDLARVMDELEDWELRDGTTPPAASAVIKSLPPSVPVARASPFVSVGEPQRTHRTHASTAPVGLLEGAANGMEGGMQRLQAAFGAEAAAAGGGRARSSVGTLQGASTASRFASGLAVASVPGVLSNEAARSAQFPVSMPVMTATVAATAAALGLRGNHPEHMYVLGELVQTARASESARRSPYASGVPCGVVYTASASNSGAVTAAEAAAMAAAAAAAARGSSLPSRTASSGASTTIASDAVTTSAAGHPQPLSGSGRRDVVTESGDAGCCPPPALQQQLSAVAATAVTAARGSTSSANGHCASMLTSSPAGSSLWSSSMQSSAVMPFPEQNPNSVLNISAAGGAIALASESNGGDNSTNLSCRGARVLAIGSPTSGAGAVSGSVPAGADAAPVATEASTSAGKAAVDNSPFVGLQIEKAAVAAVVCEGPGSPWHSGARAPASNSTSAAACAASGPGSASQVPGLPTTNFMATAFGSTFRAGSNLGSGSGGFSRASTAALNSGPGGGGGSAAGPELTMVWPLVMPTTVPAVLAGEPGDEQDEDVSEAAAGRPFSLHVLVSCGCGASHGCYCAPPEAAGGAPAAAADSHTCTPPGSALSLARTLAAPDTRRGAASAVSAAGNTQAGRAADLQPQQRVTVNAMLSGVQLAQVPLQDGGGCQGALLRLPLLPAMQLVNVFTAGDSGDGTEPAAAAGPATNLLAVPPAMAAELHNLFAERVQANLQRLTELTADGEDPAAAAARRRDLEALRTPCASRAAPPWRLSAAVWAACRSEWRSSMQPLLADICYLMLCVPNCFAHGLVEWDRAMYCETLARLLGQLERYKLWCTISVLLGYCRRQGVALLYQGEAVGAGSLTAERVRALLEGALHDEISIKAVDGAGGAGFGFQVGGQSWTAAAGLPAPCRGIDEDGEGGDSDGGKYSSMPAPTAAAMAAALGVASGSTGGGGGSGARVRRASVTILVPPDAADAATAWTLKAWRRRSVDTSAVRAAHAQEAAAAAAAAGATAGGRNEAPPVAASSGAGFTAGSALLPPTPGPAPVRTLRSQASIGRVLTRVLTAMGAGADDAVRTPAATLRTAAVQHFGDTGLVSAVVGGGRSAAGAPGTEVEAAKTRGQRLGHVIEGAAVVLAFAGVMLQSLL
ncbi:hypothetical protein HYH02_005747 [Chlamydomonas schloesseri]|uniref:Uncharacterized protein n=1 Tax=Chlamydomonas schloesseri TaxID=2026947 RepID=A0A835WJT7_9CHLO|nr:hypothetical protein HYH02_005747 [Chlamydomonas schloesseri]|eukprot:KAG2448993.1 hypothetical protein HYH02_005747 [Chlamydomonas schloesseri]